MTEREAQREARRQRWGADKLRGLVCRWCRRLFERPVGVPATQAFMSCPDALCQEREREHVAAVLKAFAERERKKRRGERVLKPAALN